MKYYEIRQLIENFYDIQKIRVETFNRLVCWVKENKEKIKEILSHPFVETQKKNASQANSETHPSPASQRVNESHYKFALSHKLNEIQVGFALKLLEEKKYSVFVKKFILSQGINETQSRLATIFSDVENLVWFHNKLYETEKELQKRLDFWSKEHPLRKEFLNYVKGIGGILSSGLIAWLGQPILKAEYCSQIWSYCGLTPESKRKKGKKVKYNPKLKTFCWKIGQSFIKFKCFGRELYLKFKEDCKKKHPDWTKLHIHNYARRKVVKIFIACLWEKWRKINGLKTTKPYPIEILNHKHIITPENWIQKVKK
ncbi:hypothetical protein DRJ16_00120 [Candidatus Woesearchaeota archaeon]|nr:MAG: hypothetical protein DRJ16_00120 [Candidatus Woesearchaeota archaeon]